VLEHLRHPGFVATLGVASVVMFVLSIVGVPLVLIRLPADYFSAERRQRASTTRLNGPLGWLFLIAKNALGALLLVLGLAMLVLPGQGLLTLLVALLLLDFPGKYRLERRIIGGPRVLGAINALRERWNKQPLEIPPLSRR
jgi:hypothetical protein